LPQKFTELVFLICVAALAACSSLPQSPALLPLTSTDAFSFSGRIAVHEPERSTSGGIRWQHVAARDEILLTSPLGQGVAQIVRDADGATLRTADDNLYRGKDAEDLAWGITGWRIPVNGLTYWVRGVAGPGISAGEERDERGRLTSFRQDEWRVEYPAYFDDPDSGLPRRIVLTRPEFELKLVIDAWDRAP
jgi:outer membrane lipoprotein LolB